MNHILENQNNDENLQLLAAQRQIYSDAKLLQVIEIILTIPLVVLFAWVSNRNPDLTVYNAIYAFFILIADLLYFEPKIKNLKERAARIQELFDCNLFKLRWNNSMAGEKPDEDEINFSAQKYINKQKDFSVLKNWYSKEIGDLPLEIARLGCQKTNCWWDSKLRKSYNITLFLTAAIITTVLVVLAIQNNTSVIEFVLSVSVLVPIYNFLGKQYRENKCATKIAEDLKHVVNKTWKSISQNPDKQHLTELSRDLQNEIYSYRKNNPLIPDLFYFLFRSEYENQTETVLSYLTKIKVS